MMAANLKKFRQDLHQIPEPGLEEFSTKDYLLTEVEPLRCIVHDVGDTGLILYFDNQKETTIGFRADMDALPISEQTGLPFASKNPGYMHACGHDGHMAILLGLAHYINDHLESLDKNVVLIFQPSEEREAGAHIIIESGILERYGVSALYGLHLWPGLEHGKLYTKPGAMMSAGSELDITIRGKSAHVASAHEGIDTLEIACRFLGDLYNMETRYPAPIPRLLKFGSLHVGAARNIIADTAHIKGTLRSYDKHTHLWFKKQIKDIAQSYADDYDCLIEISYFDGYEALINDQDLYNKAAAHLPHLERLSAPVMQSEDFGCYGRICPTLFFFLGIGETAPLHHPEFDFDMEVLEVGLGYLVRLLEAPL